MKTKLKRKSLTGFVSMILLIMLIGSLNSNVSAKAAPSITEVEYPVLITAGETIRIVVHIEYDSIFYKVGVSPDKVVTGVYLYYNINSRIKYDTFKLYQTGEGSLEWRPEYITFTISTNNFITGDYVKFKIQFDWANIWATYQGTVDTVEHRIDYRETDENYEVYKFWYENRTWIIIAASVFVALVLLYMVRKKRRSVAT